MDPEAIAAACGFPAGPWLALLRRLGVADPAAWAGGWAARLTAASGQQLSAALPPASLWGLALPLLARLEPLLAGPQRTVVGLNGPVGAGKSTLLRALVELGGAGDRLAIASIDDFYLPWPERRQRLADNPFAVLRGPPGSHDPELLYGSLVTWLDGGSLTLPRFDKRLRQGQGDRCGSWSGTPRVLLLEGWLLGCRPLPQASLEGRVQPLLARVDPAGGASADGAPMAYGLRRAELAWLPQANRALAAYAPVWDLLGSLWLLRPGCWSWPWRWRFQAEARQRRSGGASLGAEALGRLVRACGACLPPELYQDPLIPSAEAVVLLDRRRRPRWVGGGDAFAQRQRLERWDQASASSSASLTG